MRPPPLPPTDRISFWFGTSAFSSTRNNLTLLRGMRPPAPPNGTVFTFWFGTSAFHRREITRRFCGDAAAPAPPNGTVFTFWFGTSAFSSTRNNPTLLRGCGSPRSPQRDRVHLFGLVQALFSSTRITRRVPAPPTLCGRGALYERLFRKLAFILIGAVMGIVLVALYSAFCLWCWTCLSSPFC